jgi:spermidine synthase
MSDALQPDAMNAQRALNLTVLLIGFSGLVAQVLLLRELLIVFGGNELLIGVIIANWLVLGGIGALLPGKWAHKFKAGIDSLAIVAIAFSLSLPFSVYLTRVLKSFLGVAIGEGMGFLQILYCSFLVLMPVSILNGALFTICCKANSAFLGEDTSAVTKVYIFSTAGTVTAGITWTYLLVPYFDAFQVSAVLAMLVSAGVLLLLFYSPDRGKMRKPLLRGSGLLFVLCGYLLVSGHGSALHTASIANQWRPLNVVHYQNSVYSNIVVTELEGQITFFLDGSTYSTIPFPDIVGIEEFVHTPMLTHPRPERVLVLGKGAGGTINTVLTHPTVESVDYVELDPVLISLKRKFSVPLTEAELQDNRVRISYIDGRRFLKTTDSTYDLILLGPSDPSDVRNNRYFTREFFTLAQRRLNSDGILVLSIPGSLSYTTEELRNLNASVFHTLKSVFPFVRAFPQQSRTVFFASDDKAILSMDNTLLMDRIFERNLQEDLRVPWHIERMLHPGWDQWFEQFITGGSQSINHDLKPRAVFYSLAHWNTRFALHLRAPFRWMQRITLPMLAAALAATAAAGALLLKQSRERALKTGIPLCIATTGFAGMVFDLMLIFAFQAVYGFVFSWIGLLIAAFMAGIAVGAMSVAAIVKRVKNALKLFLALDIAIMLFSLLLALSFILLRFYIGAQTDFPALKAVFLVLSLVSGVLVGAQFPLANSLYLDLKGQDQYMGTAGLIYGADLLGGGAGGIIGGVMVLPLIGLIGTCILVVLLKLVSFVIVAHNT